MSYMVKSNQGPSSMSKGEIYQKLQAARRTQLRRRAESKDQTAALVEGGLSYASGVAMGYGFTKFPELQELAGVDTKLVVGIAGVAYGAYAKGDLASYSATIGQTALALAGAEMGISMASK